MPVFHIFCEGKKTEPYYLRGYLDHYHSTQKRLVVIENSKNNTAESLVEEAIRYKKREGNKNDVYWVVYDRESIAKYPHDKHLKARKKADTNQIQIAFSNISFEYWLLLHMTYTDASYSSCDDLLKNSSFKKLLLERGINDYDKGYPFLFQAISQNQGVDKARANGKKIQTQQRKSITPGRTDPCYLNPYTDVHELLTDIQNFLDGTPSCRS